MNDITEYLLSLNSYSGLDSSPRSRAHSTSSKLITRQLDCTGRLPSPLPRLRSISKAKLRNNDTTPQICGYSSESPLILEL